MLKNLRNTAEFDALERRIKETADGRDIIFAPSYGNWGDGLIHRGVEQFFKQRAIGYKTLTRDQIDKIRESLNGTSIRLRDSVLISCGGGSWCKNFHGNRDFVARSHDLFDEVIVMPSTYELPPIEGGRRNITYVARDNLTSRETIGDTLFCHDMAFYLELPVPFEVPSGKGTGIFLREDKERHPGARALGPSLDLSLLGNQSSHVTPFFKILAPYRKIVTDRMHVAIAGAMLGKSIELYVGAYFKSSDLYESTLRRHYPNVKLMKW